MSDFEIVKPKPKKAKVDPRLQAKHFFLTYSQIAEDCDKQDTLKAFKQVFGDNLLYIVISSERHKDLGYHFHVALTLKQTIKIDPRKFDQFVWTYNENKEKVTYHPNVLPARNQNNVLEYVVKGGGILEYF